VGSGVKAGWLLLAACWLLAALRAPEARDSWAGLPAGGQLARM